MQRNLNHGSYEATIKFIRPPWSSGLQTGYCGVSEIPDSIPETGQYRKTNLFMLSQVWIFIVPLFLISITQVLNY